MTFTHSMPLDIDLKHGDHTLGTITIDLPLEASEPHTGDDGNRYITVTPDLRDGWLEDALRNALQEA